MKSPRYWRPIHGIGFAFFLGTGAHSATMRVPEDFPTVLAGVDAAAMGDSVLIGPGTWTDIERRWVSIGGIPRNIAAMGFLKGGITVIGSAGWSSTILDVQEAEPATLGFVLASDPGGPVLLEGMTIRRATPDGVAVGGFSSGGITIRGCRITDNAGTAIYVDSCDLEILDSEVSDNRGNLRATIEVGFCDVTIERTRCERNASLVLTHVANSTTSLTIRDCIIADNRRELAGQVGGVVAGVGSVTIENNLWLRNTGTISGGALRLSNGGHGTIRYNAFVRDSVVVDTYGVSGGALLAWGFDGEISNNLFFECHSPHPYDGSAVDLAPGAATVFRNNVVVGSSGGAALRLAVPDPFALDAGCNVVWLNSGGDYSETWIPHPTNVSADPLFCDAANFDFSVGEDSPCLSQNNACGLIGPFDIGCTKISIQRWSWGRIKELYR